MQLHEFMSKKIVTVEADDSLMLVKEVFDHTKFHHLLVVEKNVLCGVISDRDLFKHLSPFVGGLSETLRDTATLNKKAHQIMAHHPVTLPAEATIKDVVEVFQKDSFSCIPVVDVKNHPLGIITWRDLLKFIAV